MLLKFTRLYKEKEIFSKGREMKMIKRRLKVTQTDYKNRKINCIFKMTNTMLATSENQRKYIFLDDVKILKSFFIKGF